MDRFVVIILTCSLLFNYSDLLSQKCKFDYDIEDPMTEQRRFGKKLKITNRIDFRFDNTADILRIKLHMRLKNSSIQTIEAGSAFNLRLTDNQIITLVSESNVTGNRNYYDKSVEIEYNIHYVCENKTFELIAQHGIKAFGLKIGNDEISHSMEEKLIKRSSTFAQCLIEK